MGNKQPSDMRERVVAAAEAVLDATGSVGPLELLQQMCLLMPGHVTAWRKGIFESIAGCIQGSPDKLEKAFQYLQQWAAGPGGARLGGQGLDPAQSHELR